MAWQPDRDIAARHKKRRGRRRRICWLIAAGLIVSPYQKDFTFIHKQLHG
jgi:hypothetical protein